MTFETRNGRIIFSDGSEYPIQPFTSNLILKTVREKLKECETPLCPECGTRMSMTLRTDCRGQSPLVKYCTSCNADKSMRNALGVLGGEEIRERIERARDTFARVQRIGWALIKEREDAN